MNAEEKLAKLAEIVQRYLDGLITEREAINEVCMIVASA